MRIFLIFLLAGLLAPATAPAETRATFPIPGVDFSNLSFDVGAWCRYYVADEALGVIDSTEIYLGVTGRETTARGPAYWIEMETRPRGGENEDARLLRLLVLEEIRSFSEGDSLGQYVLKLYNKNGIRPLEEEDPGEFEDFTLVVPTTESQWESTPDVPAGTAAGEFTCTVKNRTVNNDKEIMTGNVRLIKQSRDDVTVWFSDDVPVFHMARCEIVRIRRTDTKPRIAGIPPSTRRDSRTTAELVAYGFDARSMVNESDN